MAAETVRGSAAIIYKADAGPVTVAEAQRLVLGALPPEWSGTVVMPVDDNGEVVENSWMDVVIAKGVHIYAAHMWQDFIEACKHLGIEPRMKYRPTVTGYTGADAEDEYYTITHAEFVQFAQFYGVAVIQGSALEPTAPMPVNTDGAIAQNQQRGDQWKSVAQDRARAIIADQRKRDLYPPQIRIAEQIAREFRAAVPPILGADGKPLTGETIKRYALKGISSAQGKTRSTAKRRGE